MIPGLPLAFAMPWLLAALIALPVIWWLLRFTPPRPLRVAFPPTRILLELDRQEETPSTSPWWLVLLRVLIAALVIFALARPILNPPAVVTGGEGPLLVIVDDGWGSAGTWHRISRTADELLAQAESDDRPVVLVATATDTTIAEPGRAGEMRERLAGLSPVSHAPDRQRLTGRIAEAVNAHGVAEAVWLSDGLEHGAGAAFAEAIAAAAGDFRVVTPGLGDLPLALGPAANEPGGLTMRAMRASGEGPQGGAIVARDVRGREIATTRFAFAPDETAATAAFDLPVELRNEIARLEIAGQNASGAVQLLDDRWRRRVVGLVSGEAREAAQPLLSPVHYLARALGPFADVRRAPEPSVTESINTLLDQRVSALMLADIGTLIGDAHHRVEEWVAEGGVLVRFAGPRLTGEDGEDNLLPTTLRRGERALGGTLSWSEPQPLAAFPSNGPFAGIEVPDDVRVARQVLAEPSAELSERTWASLADGTPLVTGTRLGQGWVVLFHITAEANWSNLPLSGAFVEMLRRVVDLAGAGEGAAQAGGGEGGLLRPLQTLEATGALVAPPSRARPIEAAAFAATGASIEHPPGLYGEPDAFRALNVMRPDTQHAALALPDLPAAIYPAEDPRAIGPWLLAAALALLVLDGIAVLLLGGRGFGRWRRRAAAAGLALAFAVVLAAPQAALAQDEAPAATDEFALLATLDTRLAYVLTGDPQIDRVSKAGLTGLSHQLTRRTALEPAPPIGVDVATDELAFFPFIYWPIDHAGEIPSADVLARVDAYMRQGGTILFDTRDELEQRQGADGLSAGPGMQRLRAMMRGLDIPELEPVPSDHVLTKAFYLLQDFPGRWEGGTLWVEAALRDQEQQERPVHNADGVSSILVTSNDLAGAWAMDESRRPMFPTSPGGDWQRELSYRAGINIIMYAMTGNYKADQVHVPALLERLGQ